MTSQPPIKILGTETLMSLPARHHLTHVAPIHCWRNKVHPCLTSLGEDFKILCLVFPGTLPHMPFPFADFALYPFTVINNSHEYDCLLSPVNPPSKSLNLGVALETLNTQRKELKLKKVKSLTPGHTATKWQS